MKRLVLFLLVLILLVDFAEDGYLGKVKFCPPNHSAKTSVTSSHHHPGSGQTNFQHELASPTVLESPYYGEAWPAGLQVPPTLHILHCCHLSSSGGIPL
jgi:hypothetical protein